MRTGAAYPYEQLDRIWKTVLLHQFHDILPGSSIAWVHREAEATYAALAAELDSLIDGAQQALAGDTAGGRELVFNSAPHPRSAVPAGGAAPAVLGSGACEVIERPEGGFLLRNGLLDVVVDADGLVASVVEVASGRETVAPGTRANLLQLHPDFPNMWDAWDVDQFYRNTVTDLTAVDALTALSAPDQAAVRVARSFGSSTVVQTLTLRAGEQRLDIDTEVDWHETEKFLKAAFPLDVHTERYAAETQFGHLYRPTHTNTSWDAAKFEACNHRFVHLDEPGWGVALVTASTYGHDVTRAVRDTDGGTTTTVRFSLLRAPLPRPEDRPGPAPLPARPRPGCGDRRRRPRGLPDRPARAARHRHRRAGRAAGAAGQRRAGGQRGQARRRPQRRPDRPGLRGGWRPRPGPAHHLLPAGRCRPLRPAGAALGRHPRRGGRGGRRGAAGAAAVRAGHAASERGGLSTAG